MSRALISFLCVFVMLAGCQTRYMTSGKVYMQQSNWEKAREQFELEVQANPQNGEAYGYLGQCYYELGQWQKAGESFEKAISLVTIPKKLDQIKQTQRAFAAEHIKRGNNLYGQQKYAEAAQEYIIATQIEPRYIDAYKNLGLAWLRTDSLDLAKAAWAMVLDLSSRGDETWLQAHDVFAKLAMQDSSFTEALAHTDSMLVFKPNDVELLMFRAGLLDAVDRLPEALEAYSMVVAIDSTNTDALFNVGVLQSKMGNLAAAEEAFEAVVRMVPDDTEAQYNMGIMAMNLQQWDMARDAFQKVVDLDPAHGHAWQNLGICLLRLGDMKAGKAAFDRASQLGVH